MCCSRAIGAKVILNHTNQPNIEKRPTLQCKSIRRFPSDILTQPNQATGHLTLQLVRDGEESSMRSSITSRYAKASRIAQSHISTPLPRRLNQRQSKQISSHHQQCPISMKLFRNRCKITNSSINIRILN